MPDKLVKKRHSHRTIAGVEDGLALVGNIRRLLVGVRGDIDLMILYADKLIETLQEVRKGPDNYDPNKPSGFRITIRRR